MLRFEFPSLGMGAGVGTRPSFTPKGLPYSHHFRLSLCGHQVRPVWADTWAHMGTYLGVAGVGTGTKVETQACEWALREVGTCGQKTMETCTQTWQRTREGTQGHTQEGTGTFTCV